MIVSFGMKIHFRNIWSFFMDLHNALGKLTGKLNVLNDVLCLIICIYDETILSSVVNL